MTICSFCACVTVIFSDYGQKFLWVTRFSVEERIDLNDGVEQYGTKVRICGFSGLFTG